MPPLHFLLALLVTLILTLLLLRHPPTPTSQHHSLHPLSRQQPAVSPPSSPVVPPQTPIEPDPNQTPPTTSPTPTSSIAPTPFAPATPSNTPTPSVSPQPQSPSPSPTSNFQNPSLPEPSPPLISPVFDLELDLEPSPESESESTPEPLSAGSSTNNVVGFVVSSLVLAAALLVGGVLAFAINLPSAATAEVFSEQAGTGGATEATGIVTGPAATAEPTAIAAV